MIIKNVIRIYQWGYGKGAMRTPLYVFSIPAETLASKAEIYKRTPHRRDGYQRDLQQSRLGKGKLGVAGYILNQMGIFPTSILVNIRKEEGKIEFTEEMKLGDNISVGTLNIPDHATWYIIDGQHRLEGLKIAMREKEELSQYPFIVTLTNEDKFYEMLLFYIVNSRAKSVPTDLAYRILQGMLRQVKAPQWIEEELLKGADRRKAIAAMIVDYLNFDPRSPFAGRIQEVGEPEKPNHITKDGTLTRYIALVLRERMFQDMMYEKVAEILIDYWNAIKETWPNCFKNHREYMLLSTLGLSVMHRLFPVIYGYCIREGNVTKEGMKKYLSFLLEPTPEHRDPDFKKPITEGWWHRVDGPGIIRGTGEGHYAEIAEKMAEKIAIALRQRETKQ